MPVIYASIICNIDDIPVFIPHFRKGRHRQIPDKGKEEETDLHGDSYTADNQADEQPSPEMCGAFGKRSHIDQYGQRYDYQSADPLLGRSHVSQVMEKRNELTSDQHKAGNHKIVEEERLYSAIYAPCIVETCSPAFKAGTDEMNQKSDDTYNENNEDLVLGCRCFHFVDHSCQRS